MRRSLALLLALALTGCATDAPPTSPGPPTAGSPSPGLSPPLPVRAACTARTPPASLPSGASVAVLATDERELTLFLVEDLTGCWIRLDPSQAPTKLHSLAVHPNRRFVLASGEVAPGKAGVAAYAIVPERAALDGLGASWMEEHWFDHPGSLAVTDDAVYMLSGGPHTGYHGGMWRWAFETGDGGLTWRGIAGHAHDAFFLQKRGDGAYVYLGTEVDGPSGWSILVYRVGPGGILTLVSETSLGGQAAAVADPAGTFFWVVTHGRTDRLDAYRPAPNGSLGSSKGAVEWRARAPVPHPSGRVLYSASAMRVEAYAVDPLTGTPRLTAQVDYADGDQQPLAVDPSGRFLYAASATEVHAFRTDGEGRLEEYGRVAPGGTRLVLTRVP